MRISKLIRRYLAILNIFFSMLCHSQGSVTIITDSTSLNSYWILRGDTIMITYDSAFVLNKKTYRLYRENYLRVQQGDITAKKLVNALESLIAFQDSVSKNKEAYYQNLKNNFDSIFNVTNRFIVRTDVNLSEVVNSVDKIDGHINNTIIKLNEAIDKTKLLNRERIKLVVKGFAVGVGVSALIFVIAK